MPANLRRYLPFILIGVLVITVVPSLFKKHSGVTTNTRVTQTLSALHVIDRAQQKRFAAGDGYTAHLADLVVKGNGLALDLALPVVVQLDAAADGKSYVVQLESNVLSLVRSRRDGKLVADTCTVLSGSGVKCPAPASK
jgi:hypothetical protein